MPKNYYKNSANYFSEVGNKNQLLLFFGSIEPLELVCSKGNAVYSASSTKSEAFYWQNQGDRHRSWQYFSLPTRRKHFRGLLTRASKGRIGRRIRTIQPNDEPPDCVSTVGRIETCYPYSLISLEENVYDRSIHTS